MSTPRTFKPSQVQLVGIPLMATMGKLEVEAAAALLVRACQIRGDQWQALSPPDVGAVLGQDVADGVEPFKSLSRNPFWIPDFFALVKRGFAQFDQGTKLISFTDAGLAALERWVRHA